MSFNHFKNLDISIDTSPSLLDGVVFSATVPTTTFELVLQLANRVDSKTYDKLKELNKGQIQIGSTWHTVLKSTCFHSKHYSYGRLFAPLSQLDRQLRFKLFRVHFVEIDASNFVPQTLSQIAKTAGISSPSLEFFVNNRETVYKDIKENRIKQLRIETDPKQWMLIILNGYAIPRQLELPDFYYILQSEIIKIDRVIDVLNEYIDMNPKKKRKPQSARCRWIDTLEIRIQELCIEYLQTQKAIPRNEFIPIHDGLLIESQK